jgi:hypothetical protein
MSQSFFDIENRREYLEDTGRRHERFPYRLWKIAKAGESLHKEIRNRLATQDKAGGNYPPSLSELIDAEHGFIQAHFDKFDVNLYTLALYNDEIREKHFFPKPVRVDLEPIKRNSRLESPIESLHHNKTFYERSVRRINEKPKHLREFSGKFMDVFKCLYVGNGFRCLGNYINFLRKGRGMKYECEAFVLPAEDEAEFLNSVKSVRYIGVKPIPKIPRSGENWFFTNGWPSKTDAFLLIFNDGKKPMVAYLNRDYEGGILLVENRAGEDVVRGKDEQQRRIVESQRENKIMAKDLNELESGLGDKIMQLLKSHRSYPSFLKVKEKITSLLNGIGFTPSEIYVRKSNRRTPSLATIFEDLADSYQCADQFDA